MKLQGRREPRYNPHYPDRVPASFRSRFLPRPVSTSPTDVPQTICAVCSRPFRAYYALKFETKSGHRYTRHRFKTQGHRGPRLTCSGTCASTPSAEREMIRAIARRGADPNPVLNASSRRINRAAYRAIIINARNAEIREHYLRGTLTPKHFTRLSIHHATIAAITLMNKPDLFNPHQASRLRARIYDIVEKSLADVGHSLSTDPTNTRVMSPAQVALFKSLLGKVLPDLNASFNVNETRKVPADQLSREDLERLATGDPALEIEVLAPVTRRQPTPAAPTPPTKATP